MKIKKEAIPFTILTTLICLNIPAVLILNAVKPELLETFALIVVPIECILIGLSIIYLTIPDLKIKKGYNTCIGTIEKTNFKNKNANWLKTPIVSYTVDNKKYEVNTTVGINGIISFFLKGLKVKVHYKIDNPNESYVNNYTALIVGTAFFIIGIIIFIVY